MVPALLVDYGEVISQAQPATMLAEMAMIAGLEVPLFVERYWKHRPAYDRGGEARTFWSDVTERVLADETLQQLVSLDVASWSHLNSETLQVLSAARQRGASLSLLSNAPHDLATALKDHPALSGFDHLIFSARIGVAKPDPAAFDTAVEQLSRRPEEVLFIDDRPANVQAASDAGLRAVLFTSAAELRSELLR
jgi:putative hydrolase of the HAD superfamily